MNIRKKFVFLQALSIRKAVKTKNWGSQGEKLGGQGVKNYGQTWHRDNCSHAKKYNKNIETLLAKQIFSLII